MRFSLLCKRGFKINRLSILLATSMMVSVFSSSVGAFHMDPSEEVCSIEDPVWEPEPRAFTSNLTDSMILDEKEINLIERLARGIHDWKTGREHGWWECGEFTETGRLTEDKAIMLAYRLVRAARKYSDDNIEINVWGLAATIAHESSFDRCAVGYHFRKWAIRKSLIKPRKRTISYGERELLDAMASPKARWWFDKTGVDVGYCQLLTRFYDGKRSEMMGEVKGLEICARQFKYRAKVMNTSRPWKWWRGHKAKWYDTKVTRRAMALGAKRHEI